MKKKLTVITSSIGNSGAGLIHDYLLGRTDFKSPFFGQEFRLISDPYGIENLYNNFFSNFSLNNSSEALNQFEKYSVNFCKIHLAKKKIIGNEKVYLKEVSNYIKNIKKIEYVGYPQYKRVSQNKIVDAVYKGKKFLFKMNNFEFHNNKMSLPTEEKEFINFTKKFLNNIFSINSRIKKNIVLDQSTNFWKPEIVFKYFDNLKIVLINRDPRSVYYSMRSRQSFAYPGYDINLFVEWYDYMNKKRDKLSKKNKKNIIEINYERFLNNFKSESKKLNKFLRINNKINSNFNLENSKKNVYKAQQFLSKKEQIFIKNRLNKYLKW